MLRQATELIPGEARWRSEPYLELRSCILAKFRGDVRHLAIVYNKLAVFAYEHDVSLTGSFYVVFVSEKDSELAADVFAVTDGE